MNQKMNEPWRIELIDLYEGGAGIQIVTSRGEVVADNQTYYPHAIDPDVARRIVACVNACIGIPTEELEDTGAVSRIKAAEAARHLWQQRDSVLNVLVSLTAVARRYLPDYDEHPEIQRADEIIERVTGADDGSANTA